MGHQFTLATPLRSFGSGATRKTAMDSNDVMTRGFISIAAVIQAMPKLCALIRLLANTVITKNYRRKKYIYYTKTCILYCDLPPVAGRSRDREEQDGGEWSIKKGKFNGDNGKGLKWLMSLDVIPMQV